MITKFEIFENFIIPKIERNYNLGDYVILKYADNSKFMDNIFIVEFFDFFIIHFDRRHQTARRQHQKLDFHLLRMTQAILVFFVIRFDF